MYIISKNRRTRLNYIEWLVRMPHRKQRETKQQPILRHYLALLGCCLVSVHFLRGILTSHSVDIQNVLSHISVLTDIQTVLAFFQHLLCISQRRLSAFLLYLSDNNEVMLPCAVPSQTHLSRGNCWINRVNDDQPLTAWPRLFETPN